MPIFPVSKIYRDPMVWQNHIRNGLEPDWRSPLGVVQRAHFALCHCRKCVFMKTTRPGNTPQGQGGTVVPWRWYFRTGEDIASGSSIRLRAQCLMLPADNASATDPYCQIDLNSGGITSTIGRYPLVDTSPDYGSLQRVQLLATGLAPDTAYQARLDVVDFARVVSMTVHEEVLAQVNTTGTYVSDPRVYAVDNPVTDASHQEYLQDLHTLWKHNGTHLLSLVPNDSNSFWTRTTNSYANLLDTSASTTVSSSTPGFNLAAQYMDAFHSTSIPCVFAVYASNSVSAGGDVRLSDSSGALVTLSSFSTAGEWKTGGFNLTGGGDHKVDVHFQADASSHTLTVHSVCAYVYVT